MKSSLAIRRSITIRQGLRRIASYQQKKMSAFASESNFLLYGQFDKNTLAGEFAAKGIKSILYLATDSPTDESYPGGVQELKKVFPAVLAVPFDAQQPEFQGSAEVPWQGVLAYKRYEIAINSLPLPMAIVCRSARRAGAVYAAYRGVTERLSKEQVIRLAEQQNHTFLGHAGMKAWVEGVVDAQSGHNPLIFKQLFEAESSTYTYLLADAVTKEAVLIDPVLETVDRDAKLITELGLQLKYVLNTHVHADHITGSGKLKERFPDALSVLTDRTAKADKHNEEYSPIAFGSWKLYPVFTPGHTDGCTSYVLDDLSRVFTGDTLLIRACGRTDFQGGSPAQLYRSVHDKLYKFLPNETLVYPAHDYKGNTVSSIQEEKAFNPRLTKTVEEFVQIMDNLNLPKPKKIDTAVPANLLCGWTP